MNIVDLSATLSDHFPVYPGDPPVTITTWFTHAERGCQVLNVSLPTHAGTHVDVPLHFIINGKGTDTFPVDCFFGHAVTISVPKQHGEHISAADLQGVSIKPDNILLVHTGWDAYAGTEEFFVDFPSFDLSAAEYILGLGVKALGCDLPSVDAAKSEPLVHNRILGAGVGLIESMVNLARIVGIDATVVALPLKLAGGDGSPVRAIALI